MKRVLVLSDLHVGHVEGLWHPSVQDLWGTSRMTTAQTYLYRCWQDFCKRAKELKPHVLVVNGDILDGEQRKQLGGEAATNLVVAQQKAAVRLLQMLPYSFPRYFIRGTPYHDGRLGVDIEPVAESLGGTPYRKDWYSWPYLDLEVEGVTLNFMHSISVSSGFYRATAHDREGVWSALAGKAGKAIPATGVIRSHCHYFTGVLHATKYIVTTPAWQLQTEYMRRHSMYRMMPDIGALYLDVDGKDPDNPIIVRKILYALPTRKVARA